MVRDLVYCFNCGEKLPEDAYFCPKCGTKTVKGRASKAAYPADEFREAFYNVGIELEKALRIAARETHAAIQTARSNFQQKSTQKEPIVCPKCGTKNPSGSVFCYSCGTRIAPVEESHGSS
jgi:uncharacterized membrane protein YvbJ